MERSGEVAGLIEAAVVDRVVSNVESSPDLVSTSSEGVEDNATSNGASVDEEKSSFGSSDSKSTQVGAPLGGVFGSAREVVVFDPRAQAELDSKNSRGAFLTRIPLNTLGLGLQGSVVLHVVRLMKS